MFNITNNYLKKNFEDIGNVLAKTINRIDDLRTRTEDISGVPSGFSHLDRITYGWQPTDLIILAARPAVGKTAFALNLARNAALHPTKPVGVGFFSLEMSASQLVQRILSAESEIMLEKITRGKLEEYEYQQHHAKVNKKLETAPLYIDDTAALNIFEFRAKARRLVNKHQVGLIVIDYLQLMSGSDNNKGGNREQEISTISRNLKALAKELSVPIIALSQLSRAVETRKESKMPQLSDLRESGAIEQDADMVMFIYRPEYYEIGANEMGESTKGETHIRIAKHRNGSLDTVKLRANLAIQRFHDWEDEGPGGMMGGGNWKPVGPAPAPTSGGNNEGGKFFVQSSKMNSGNFDEGFEGDAPF
jgi:replicative DNA helicase